ncbi:hypothetical protein QUB37_18150 [Microcoleus sp. AT3-A2]|uniref:hypothetical protein n=1 Tax=Microcoleus sp. AT3-A2 TaxID=2818610 RepID=UPI002FD07305
MKQCLEKQPREKRDTTPTPDFAGDIPVAHSLSSDKSSGEPAVELAPPNGTNNLTEGTKKNGLRVKGMSNPK